MTACAAELPAQPSASRQPRFLPLQGAYNARDVGGLLTQDGGWVREGVLLRSDTPQLLTDADVDLLRSSYSVRTVVDLRFAHESEVEGLGALGRSGVRHLNIPIQSTEDNFAPQPLSEAEPAGPERPQWMAAYDHYVGYFAQSADQIVSAVRALAEPDALPALVHCAAGKDRTGVIIAVALSAVGVDDEQVAADYAATSLRLDEVLGQLRALPSYAERIDLVPREVHDTRAETMLALLQWLRDEHGGAAKWLVRSGLKDSELGVLRIALVQRPGQ